MGRTGKTRRLGSECKIDRIGRIGRICFDDSDDISSSFQRGKFSGIRKKN